MFQVRLVNFRASGGFAPWPRTWTPLAAPRPPAFGSSTSLKKNPPLSDQPTGLACMCSITPATLKRRRTAFSTNVAHYASRRTALFVATFGSCDVMPCYQRQRLSAVTTANSQKLIVGRIS